MLLKSDRHIADVSDKISKKGYVSITVTTNMIVNKILLEWFAFRFKYRNRPTRFRF